MDTRVFIESIEKELKICCDEFTYENSLVSEAVRYSLLGSGKRVRAILIFLTSELCGKNWKDYLRFACGVEMIHCYSLIHDDLPCMDNDDFRRGKLSCHKKFGEDTAMLAGDTLAGLGLEVISNTNNFSDSQILEAVKYTANAMGPMGMIYGQELDLEYENKPADKDTLRRIHRHKTGCMISLCGKLGTIGTDIKDSQKKSLELFFDNIGLVFQIVDDILDVEGNSETLGKPAGSDISNNKSTFVSLYGLEESKRIARELTEEAEGAIRNEFGESADTLIEYTQYLLNRNK